VGTDSVILEAVPNFSEGRDPAVVAQIADAIGSAGAHVADVHVDHDHNRSVVTAFGTHEQLLHGLSVGVAIAVKSINLTLHNGVHPRIGACDVLPIVPMSEFHTNGGDVEAASSLANALANEIGPELNLPVIRYGPGIDGGAFAGQARAGGTAGLNARLNTGEVVPLAGPTEMHPTAGAVLVGVRDVLVAFNVQIKVPDGEDGWHRAEGTAHQITGTIREANGGLSGIRALAFPLTAQNLMQVSTNVERWKDVSPAVVLDHVARLVEDADLELEGCELVGIAPATAVEDVKSNCSRRGIYFAHPEVPSIEAHIVKTSVPAVN
jgi:glutamate formiminotransferase